MPTRSSNLTPCGWGRPHPQ